MKTKVKKAIAWFCVAAMLLGCKDESVLNEAMVKFNPPRTFASGDTSSVKLTINDNRKPFHLMGVVSANKSFSSLPLRITEIDPFGDKVMLDIDVILSPKQQESGKLEEFEFTVDQKKQFHMHGEYRYLFQIRSVAEARAEEVTLLGLRVRDQQPK